jgi:hypothetical protein
LREIALTEQEVTATVAEIEATRLAFMQELCDLFAKYDVDLEYAASYYAGESSDMTLRVDHTCERWSDYPYEFRQAKAIDLQMEHPKREDFFEQLQLLKRGTQ